MSQPFEKLSQNSLRGRIAEKIRDAILDGTLPEGERLVERKLAAEFGASLTAVREALVELETDGFVAKLPNSATRVIRLSQEDAEKILSVRGVLEGFAVAEAARNATPAQMNHLVVLSGEVHAAAQAGDVRKTMQKDLALHEAIWQMAGNDPMVAALKRLILPCYSFFAIRLAKCSAQELTELVDANLPFLVAVYSNNGQVAQEALRYSLDRWMRKTRPEEAAPAPPKAAQTVESADSGWSADGLMFHPAT
jgi:DNA-binding GntR family transcriptional regulator